MAGNTIQIKRSNANTGPAVNQLSPGELAWVDHTDAGAGTTPTSNGTLYIKDAASSAAVHKIGGPGFELQVLEDSTLTGTTTLNATAFSSGTDYITADNGEAVDTKWVMEAIAASGQPIRAASDTNIEADTAIQDAEILAWDAGNDEWINQELDGVNGDVSLGFAGGKVVATVTGAGPNSIILGDMTHGNYVKSIVGGDNIDVTVTSTGNGSTAGGEEQSELTVALTGDVVISGNLDVNGTTTTVDTDIVKITDPTFLVGEHNTTADRGIEFKYGTGVQAGFFGYDQANAKFTFELGTYDSSGNGSVIGGAVGNAKFGQIEGLLMDSVQTNISQVGNITVGQWNGTNISPERGGTGIDTSAGQGKDTGALIVNGGTWDVEATLPVSYGGTGMAAALANTIVMGTGTAAMTTLAMGAANEMLKVKSDGSGLEYSAVIDGGTTF